MSILNEIQQINNNRGDLILKSFGIEKARSGIYENIEENRKLGRVGQHYGEKKEDLLIEYKKQFKDYSQEYFSVTEKFYKEENNRISKYLESKKEVKSDLDHYKGIGYNTFRQLLSDKNKFVKENTPSVVKAYEESSREISQFIQSNKISQNLVLNRRIKTRYTDFFNKLNVGDVYEDKSFSSTSLIELNHFGDFELKILAKRGTSVACADNKEEYEYIIDKNSQFRVLEKGNKSLTVELL
jgi:hypothetical protein